VLITEPVQPGPCPGGCGCTLDDRDFNEQNSGRPTTADITRWIFLLYVLQSDSLFLQKEKKTTWNFKATRSNCSIILLFVRLKRSKSECEDRYVSKISIITGIATGTVIYVIFFEIFPKAKTTGKNSFLIYI
jgi:hypothetical protein